MRNIYIYKITNIKNNKVYIGQSIRPINQRFHRHINDAMNGVIDTHLARAIKKYGKDSFTIEQIDTAKTQEELTLKEQEWIRCYNSTNSQYGYNETDAIYKSGGNTYKNKSLNEMLQISKKISNSKKGVLNPNAHSVKCYSVSTDVELYFDTLKECQEYFGEETHRFITTRVTAQTHSLYKGEWKIAYTNCEYYDFYEKCPKRGIEIEVFDTENETSSKYLSMRQASRETGISRDKLRAITACDSPMIIDDRYLVKVLNQKCIDYP